MWLCFVLTDVLLISHFLNLFEGVVAVEEAGGPKTPFRLGREDATDGSTSPPDGRLPDADKGSRVATAQHLRDVFYRMGFTDQEIVALSGAHAMGRCHTDRSGYWVGQFLNRVKKSTQFFQSLGIESSLHYPFFFYSF